MIIDSKAYGKISIDEKQIFHFSNGVLGFENVKDYALLDASQPPFMWLQSIEVSHLAFIVIDPTIFRADYDPNISDSELELIELTGKDDGNKLVLAIVTIPENQNNMTANLQGPIILNKEQLLGRQFVSTDDKWDTRHYVMEELANQKETSC